MSIIKYEYITSCIILYCIILYIISYYTSSYHIMSLPPAAVARERAPASLATPKI